MKQEYLFFYLHKYLLIYNNHIIFMSLFLITVKSRLAANLTVMEKRNDSIIPIDIRFYS